MYVDPWKLFPWSKLPCLQWISANFCTRRSFHKKIAGPVQTYVLVLGSSKISMVSPSTKWLCTISSAVGVKYICTVCFRQLVIHCSKGTFQWSHSIKNCSTVPDSFWRENLCMYILRTGSAQSWDTICWTLNQLQNKKYVCTYLHEPQYILDPLRALKPKFEACLGTIHM
jgi:hypothetical protein